jgi:LEA14-like dessication related protein
LTRPAARAYDRRPLQLPKTSTRVLAIGAALGLAACASVKPPTLRVQGLGLGRVGITGANLHVTFGVRNPNPEDLLIERFEYELILNGHRLGRGYVADPVSLRGFGEEGVSSDFNLNFLNVPGTVKAILDRDRVRTQARGHFYVRAGGGFKKIGFDAEVDLRK